MKVLRALLIAAAIVLMLLLNTAAVYGFFYHFVYNVTPEQDIARLDEAYRDADILEMHLDPNGWGQNWYLLVQLTSGETRLLAMQGSQYFTNRYCYLPKSTLQIPAERPYSCTVRTQTETVLISIDAENHLETREGTAHYPAPLDTLYSYLPFLLFAAELAIGGIVIHIRKKRKSVHAV